MSVDSVLLRVLGTVSISTISGESCDLLPKSFGWHEELLLRAIAAHPEGVRVSQIVEYFELAKAKPIHDAANRIRTTIARHGLNLAGGRSGYRIQTIEGVDVDVDSDVAGLSKSAAFLSELERAALSADVAETETPELLAELTQLDKLVDIWKRPVKSGSRQSSEERSRILMHLDDAHRTHELRTLDEVIRRERARRSVSVAERMNAQARVEHARKSIIDYDTLGPDHDAIRHQLSVRLKRIEQELVAQRDTAEDRELADVFLAAPMEAATDYVGERSQAAKVSEALREHCGVARVFFAGDDIADSDEFESPSVGLGRNMPYFRSATKFVLIYPEKSPSGVLVEAGMALAIGASSVFFVKSRDDLPWILRNVSEANDSQLASVRVISYRDEEHLLQQIRANGQNLFPPARQ